MRLITAEKFPKAEFDKRLRYKTEPVSKVTENLQEVALDMLEFMYQIDAVGLAANQVGLKIRLCVIDPAFMYGKKMPIVMFNPEFVEHDEELFESPEGCLSLPNMGLRVPRFRNVKVRFTGLDNKEYTIQDDNSLLASVVQHEIDHLDGVLMTDRVPEEVRVKYQDSIIL
jgi:peptide deformylase